MLFSIGVDQGRSRGGGRLAPEDVVYLGWQQRHPEIGRGGWILSDLGDVGQVRTEPKLCPKAHRILHFW